MRNLITFRLLDYWHAGAGHGAGRLLDAAVKRSPAGLPILPGRTVKGLMRDAVRQCEQFGHLSSGITEELFGSKLGTGRFETEAGVLSFGNAELGEEWEDYAQTDEGKRLVPAFFDELASTAIGDDGQAEEGSLRRIEVAIPLTLRAPWSVDDPQFVDPAQQALAKSVGLVRRLGVSRNRGLGRVQVSLSKEGE